MTETTDSRASRSRVAVTGGTGFVGSRTATRLVRAGHEVVLVARGERPLLAELSDHPAVEMCQASLGDLEALEGAFQGCHAVAHCAGINREIGRQTYRSVHVEGTRNVIEAARRAGAGRIALMSFLRARPGCGSGYHESKWRAEELVRRSGLEATVLKCGVIYGRGDHMLDHLSHALYTFPVFGLVGMRPRPVAPVAVADVAEILHAALVDGRLGGRTVAVLGPEMMTLRQAVERVAAVVGKRPVILRLPVFLHDAMAMVEESFMRVPLAARAQVRILAEGIVEPLPWADDLPVDLRPRRRFSPWRIRAGLPEPGPFTLRDCRLPLGIGQKLGSAALLT